MSRCVLSALVLVAAQVAGCSVDVPEGVFACDDDSDCPPGMRCTAGLCRSRAGRDGGLDRPDGSCDCNDGVACTIDDCVACTHTPDDTLCTAAPGGVCDREFDCQYPFCDADTCMATGCRSAVCIDNVCTRDDLCASDQECCGGVCGVPGCDDGNPCTTDSCGPAGCVNTHNTDPCDDGVACTIGDRCNLGACAPGPFRDCGECANCNGGLCDPIADGTRCSVAAGARCCSGACVDIATSSEHCGGCGLRCPSGSCTSVAGGGPVCSCTSGSTVDCPDELNYTCRDFRCDCLGDAGCAAGQTCQGGGAGPNFCAYGF